MVGGGTDTTLSITETRFIPLFGTDATASEAGVLQTLPVAGTLSNFRVTLHRWPDNGGGSQFYAFTVRRNGVDTGITCNVLEFETACSDTTHSQLFNAGDTFAIRADPFGSPRDVMMHWTAVFN